MNEANLLSSGSGQLLPYIKGHDNVPIFHLIIRARARLRGLYQLTIILRVSICHLPILTFQDVVRARCLPVRQVTIVKRRRRPIIRSRHALTIQLRMASNVTNVKGPTFTFRFATSFRHLAFCCTYESERHFRHGQVFLLRIRFVIAKCRNGHHRCRRHYQGGYNRHILCVSLFRVRFHFGS